MSPHATWFEFLPGYRSCTRGCRGCSVAPGPGRCSRRRTSSSITSWARCWSSCSCSSAPAATLRPSTAPATGPGAAAQVRPAQPLRDAGGHDLQPDGQRDGREGRPPLPAAHRHALLLHPVLEPAGAHSRIPAADRHAEDQPDARRCWSSCSRTSSASKSHGIKYFKHFMGPVWWLAPLMIPIEIVSHLARPVSLSMRLLGNIAADHAVVLAFFAIIPFLVPVPLPPAWACSSRSSRPSSSRCSPTVYIGQAVAHEEH